VTRPLKPVPRMTEAERVAERRFFARLVAGVVAAQIVGGALVFGLMMRRHPVMGGAPPMPELPHGGATDVRAK
jgi:hypothetical protein